MKCQDCKYFDPYVDVWGTCTIQFPVPLQKILNEYGDPRNVRRDDSCDLGVDKDATSTDTTND